MAGLRRLGLELGLEWTGGQWADCCKRRKSEQGLGRDRSGERAWGVVRHLLGMSPT